MITSDKVNMTDDKFNNLDWKSLEWTELEKTIAGYTIIGGEPVDYPNTDGLILYLKSPTGVLVALDIETETPLADTLTAQLAGIEG